jgi:periplasmic divalent cation tolerance protein
MADIKSKTSAAQTRIITELLAEDTPNLRDLNCPVREISLPVPHKRFPLTVMNSARHVAVVLVTAPDLKAARALARAALEARLVACANLVPRLESHYWWQGRLERSAEVLILFKTARGKLAGLERLILARHPYDTPEILALPLDSGTLRYLGWIVESVS